ncbi:MAG: GNAT family N-acetyltransferase [Prevotellaceae bacterium]|jgi:L-amino acid N-acyltransferase YncA|nr:GNAT family N-acetyltransferase [Prevotellaceae bacterium]
MNQKKSDSTPVTIRSTTWSDLPAVMQAYEYARALMRAQGNTTQWTNGYPSEALIRSEIDACHSFVCTDRKGELLGTFCFITGEDPTYVHIYEGAWLNDEPYGVVHRLATNGKQPGIGKACLDWCAARCQNLRIDTHQDNLLMQHLLEKQGFKRCGTIYVADGTPRIAYQRRNSSH